MKNRYRTLLLAILLTIPSLHALEGEFGMELSFVGLNMDYREYDDNGVILDSEKSNFSEMIGGQTALFYELQTPHNNSARLSAQLQYIKGESEYVGSYLGSSSGYGSLVSRTQNEMTDVSLDYRFSYLYENNLYLSYGLAIGYREWRRELSASQVEIYSWKSLRPTLGFGYSSKNLAFGVVAQYQYGLNPEMEIVDSSLVFELGAANIAKVSLPLTLVFSEKFRFLMEYSYEYQYIEKSNVITIATTSGNYEAWEPESRTNNAYLKVGFEFKF